MVEHVVAVSIVSSIIAYPVLTPITTKSVVSSIVIVSAIHMRPVPVNTVVCSVTS